MSTAKKDLEIEDALGPAAPECTGSALPNSPGHRASTAIRKLSWASTRLRSRAPKRTVWAIFSAEYVKAPQ
eukprot:14692385-Alexandrium_andersonii.AAC.1